MEKTNKIHLVKKASQTKDTEIATYIWNKQFNKQFSKQISKQFQVSINTTCMYSLYNNVFIISATLRLTTCIGTIFNGNFKIVPLCQDRDYLEI